MIDLHQQFPIHTFSRTDLIAQGVGEQNVLTLTDEDMAAIAVKLVYVFAESGTNLHEMLGFVARLYLLERSLIPTLPADRHETEA